MEGVEARMGGVQGREARNRRERGEVWRRGRGGVEGKDGKSAWAGRQVWWRVRAALRHLALGQHIAEHRVERTVDSEELKKWGGSSHPLVWSATQQIGLE